MISSTGSLLLPFYCVNIIISVGLAVALRWTNERWVFGVEGGRPSKCIISWQSTVNAPLTYSRSFVTPRVGRASILVNQPQTYSHTYCYYDDPKHRIQQYIFTKYITNSGYIQVIGPSPTWTYSSVHSICIRMSKAFRSTCTVHTTSQSQSGRWNE